MEYKWISITLIAVIFMVVAITAYDRYLVNQLAMAKVEHGCTTVDDKETK